jgi:hypothetical protein
MENEIIKKLELDLTGLIDKEKEHLEVTEWVVLNGQGFISKGYSARLCEKFHKEKLKLAQSEADREIETLTKLVDKRCKELDEMSIEMNDLNQAYNLVNSDLGNRDREIERKTKQCEVLSSSLQLEHLENVRLSKEIERLKEFVSLCVNSYKMVNNKTTPENVLNILQNRAGQLLGKEAKYGE